MTKPRTHSFEQAAAIHGYGMPDDRLARMAARRAFVEMKQVFIRAAADVEGGVGEMLQQRVRTANEPVELWRIRAVLLASLPAHHQRTLAHRIELHRQLDSLFPFNACATEPMKLGPPVATLLPPRGATLRTGKAGSAGVA